MSDRIEKNKEDIRILIDLHDWKAVKIHDEFNKPVAFLKDNPATGSTNDLLSEILIFTEAFPGNYRFYFRKAENAQQSFLHNFDFRKENGDINLSSTPSTNHQINGIDPRSLPDLIAEAIKKQREMEKHQEELDQIEDFKTNAGKVGLLVNSLFSNITPTNNIVNQPPMNVNGNPNQNRVIGINNMHFDDNDDNEKKSNSLNQLSSKEITEYEEAFILLSNNINSELLLRMARKIDSDPSVINMLIKFL